MRIFLLLLLPFLAISNDRVPVSCGPTSVYSVQSVYFGKATFIAKQSGNWNDIKTWGSRLPASTDIVGIPSGITVTFNSNSTVKGIVSDGDFVFAPGVSSTLTINNGNFIYTGLLRMRPNSYLIKHEIKFTGINELRVVGNGMEPLDTDPGLWAMGAAVNDIRGAEKVSMTESVGSITKGSNSFTVKSAAGWRVGDEVTVNPTNEIPQNQVDFNSSSLSFSDPYALKYERRTISAILGNRITVSQPFSYDHLLVNNTWTAHVFNITRNVVIGGTAGGKSHWFVRSSKPQSIEYVHLPFMGPRNPTRGDRDRGSIKSGRYPLHFHHCMDGSIGSKVTGVSVSNCGTRAFVPHVSNGIYFKDNVAFDIAEDGFFWDFGDVSNGITYDANGIMLQRLQGDNGNPSGFFMGLGDDNVAINNFVSRGDRPITGVGGDYEWIADNDSPWRMDGNTSCTGHNGIQWWQNTPWIHLVSRYTAYNMYINEDQRSPEMDAFAGGGVHGAYGNNVIYDSCIFYRAPFRIHASAVSRIGFKMINCVFDGGGSVDYVLQVHGSAIPSGIWNVVMNSTLKGYKKAAVQMYTPLFTGERAFKMAAFINNTYSGKVVEFRQGSIYDSEFWQQDGNSATVTRQVSPGSTSVTVSKIAPFYQANVSTGSGIAFKLYSGVNKDRLVREDILPSVHLPQASVDKKASPSGRHWKIGHVNGKVNACSEEYTGFITPMVTGNHSFQMKGAQAKRLTVNGVQLINAWQDVGDENHTVNSIQIYLESGKKYPIKVESFNDAPPYTLYLSWNYPGLNGYEWIDRSQLFPDNATTPPPPPINRPPVVSAGKDVVSRDSVNKIEGDASDPDNNLASIKWSGPAGIKIEQTLSEASHVLITAKPGKYTLKITGTDDKGLSASDEMILTILPDSSKPVDPCAVFSERDYLSLYPDVAAAIKRGQFTSGLQHYESYGRREGRKISTACDTSFKSRAYADSTICLDGSVINGAVAAGKYTAATQALADALALQDLNNQLAKCPVPWFTAQLPSGKTLYLFGTEFSPRIIIK